MNFAAKTRASVASVRFIPAPCALGLRGTSVHRGHSRRLAPIGVRPQAFRTLKLTHRNKQRSVHPASQRRVANGITRISESKFQAHEARQCESKTTAAKAVVLPKECLASGTSFPFQLPGIRRNCFHDRNQLLKQFRIIAGEVASNGFVTKQAHEIPLGDHQF